MHIVITFLTTSKFYINVKESTTCHEPIWQSGRSEVDAVYGNCTIEVQKKITRPGWTLKHQSCPPRVRTDSTSQCCLPASPDGEDAGSEPEWREQLALPTGTRTPSKDCPGESSPYNQGTLDGGRMLP